MGKVHELAIYKKNMSGQKRGKAEIFNLSSNIRNPS